MLMLRRSGVVQTIEDYLPTPLDHVGRLAISGRLTPQALRPQQFLYFFPEPQGHGSFRPGFFSLLTGFRVDFGAVELIDPAEAWTY
jgi:hypothetical protein